MMGMLVAMLFIRTLVLRVMPAVTATSELRTEVHRAPGYCAMRGHCGRESIFGPELPCPYNGKAMVPDAKLGDMLSSICGSLFEDSLVCCDLDQVVALRDNLKKAENLIASCPACKVNFFEFFCSFTCSPDQSLFLKIEEETELSSGKSVVTHLSHYLNSDYESRFFDSCKSVKFSATNGFVMDLIGGGAKDALSFLQFLGHKSILGSPIQIDYPDLAPENMQEFDRETKSCDDADQNYRCACVDCPQSCPHLEATPDLNYRCHVGLLPCISLGVIIAYIAAFATLIGGYLVHQRSVQRLNKMTSRLHLASRDAANLEEDSEFLLEPETDERESYAINDFLQKSFEDLGRVTARFPYATIGIVLTLTVALSLGAINVAVETDPVKLWVAPNSEAALEKNHFDSTFGPFYRTQQIFLVNGTDDQSAVLSYDTLQWWFELETQIKNIEIDGISLEDVCLNPTGAGCVIQSLTGYWQGDVSYVDESSWATELVQCADQPVNCLPMYGQPLRPSLILGGYVGSDFLQSKAMVSSIVLNNSLNQTVIDHAMAFEGGLRDVLSQAQTQAASRGLRLSFSTEISLEEELNKSTNTDIRIVIVSYIAMFLYASAALGGTFRTNRRVFIDTKFSLGLFGIVIVLLSVTTSVGVFSILGVKITLIIAEVIPFLILAVGVDNIFLLCHEFARVNARYNELEIAERVAKTLGRVGPSLAFSASSETIALAIGSIVDMPAVRNFALYAAGAVLVNAILQLTVFPAAMAIDQQRVEQNRIDCVPLIRLDASVSIDVDHENHVARFIRRKYVPYLLRSYVRVAVITIFATTTFIALALLPAMSLGLDQKIALPSDSYLINYFRDLEAYFGTGPPVYFVVRASNVSDRAQQTSLCGRFTSCQQYSMTNILEQERKRPDVSYLLEPAASWIDDMFYWLNPQLDLCCRTQKTDSSVFCLDDESPEVCQTCFEDRDPPWNISLAGMPEGDEFLRYAAAWLNAPTSEDCPLAGRATYADAVMIDADSGLITSHARSFHTPLRSQADFINSYAAARRVSNEISTETGLDVYPYAVHYVFFDQYRHIQKMTFMLLGFALLSILGISGVFLGSIKAALLLTLTVTMIIVHIAGVMVLWNISLNALSLVNLIISVGIGVEFCAHVIRAYMLPSQDYQAVPMVKGSDRERRVWAAMDSVGSSVFSGITMCKLIGVTVLAFTRSKIFEVYYFRMWLSLVIVAAVHGLIFLPILLSLAGPSGYISKSLQTVNDMDWATNASERYVDSLHSGSESDTADIL